MFGSWIEGNTLLWWGVSSKENIWLFLHMVLKICYKCNIKTQNISKSINYIYLCILSKYIFLNYSLHIQFFSNYTITQLHKKYVCPDFYLIYWAGACFSAARTGRAADILVETSFSRACLVFSVVSITASSSGICMSGSSSSICLGTKSWNLEWTTWQKRIHHHIKYLYTCM